jgi:hypothetical protein
MVAKEQFHAFHFNIFFNHLPSNSHSTLSDTNCQRRTTSSFSGYGVGFTGEFYFRIAPA